MNLVSELEEPYRSTVLLRYAEDLSPAEIGRRQQLPAGTVRWRLKTALDELRRRADERFGGDRRIALRALIPVGGGPWYRRVLKGGLDMNVRAKVLTATAGLAVVATAAALYYQKAVVPESVAVTTRASTSRGSGEAGRTAVARTPGPPRFASAPLRYDPMRSTASPMQLFRGETRDERWASAMEAIIREELGADLRRGAPEAEVTSVECRDLSCYYEAAGPEKHATATLASLQYVFYGGRCFPRGAVRVVDGKVVYAVVCLNSPDGKDIEAFRKMMVVQRDNVRRAKGTVEENVARTIEQFGPNGPKKWKR
jgi:hypothetical protein